MRLLQKLCVLHRLVERELPDYPDRYAGGERDDDQGQNGASNNDGKKDAPREEAVLPFGRHIAQDLGVDDRVVERERHFEYHEKRGDKEPTETAPDAHCCKSDNRNERGSKKRAN